VSVVLDSSAILAVVFGEDGGETVAPRIAGANVCAVNVAEAASRMIDKGYSQDDTETILSGMGMVVAPFGEADAFSTGFLRDTTRAAGLSLGDRACVALASRRKARVLTADRAWARVDLGVEIEVIR